MEGFLGSYGYLSLFAVSFLAATILPLGSEWLLATMVIGGESMWLSIAVATAGNYLGACTTYLIGVGGSPFLLERILRIDENARERAFRLYRRFGSWSLLFSWLPFIGDPLCLASGVFKTGFGRFSLLVATGKLGRYTAVAFLVGSAIKS